MARPRKKKPTALQTTISDCKKGGMVIGIIVGWPARKAAQVNSSVKKLAAETLADFDKVPAGQRRRVFADIIHSAARCARQFAALQTRTEISERRQKKTR